MKLVPTQRAGLSQVARETSPPPTGEVLLVEEDTFLAGRLEQTLVRAGLAVRRARSGRDALAEAAATPPDVLVLELELGDLTGFEVTRALREERTTRRVPVLLLARRDDPRSRAAAWACGADGFLPRPFLPSELLSSVSVLAGRGRRERAQGETAAESVRLLRGLLEVRAPGASPAGERRARTTLAFAQWLALDERALLGLERAALLQDCGRMLLPEDARSSRGPAARPHALLGSRLLASLPELADLAPVVRHHHERWDGRGSPDGLRGDAIPPAARVLALTDAWCTLREIAQPARPSRGALLRALQGYAGDGALDPCLTERFADAVAAGQVD